MHVLVAAHDCYPDPGSGGTGRYVYETGRRLVERGHRVSVVTRRRGDVPSRESLDGVDVYRYDLEVADRPAPAVLDQLPGSATAVADHVAELSAEAPVDVVSGQGPVTSLLVGRRVDAAVPRVPTFHSPWPTEYRIRTRGDRSAPRRWLNAGVRWHLERRLLARADRAVALSAYMRGELRRTYGRELDATVVPGGVDAKRYAPSAGPDDRLAAGAPAFLTVRRLAGRMGHAPLLRAFASVVERHPGAHLYVAGDGPLRGGLERMAAGLGLADHVTFLGYVPDAELPGVYASADVFVLPTAELEGFGLATLEALASGLPVVATPVGGTVEVLSGLDGETMPAPVLVESADAESLALGMAAWTDVPAADRAAAGRACRRYARQRYPWERTVDGLLAVYRGVTPGGAPRRGLPRRATRGTAPPRPGRGG
ncbi:MAG TPA: glycosyltransferase family 4 protein [Halobacteriales archaeon]|nr:glycosyltransferase family 4 protein [Halobacteriales archaeon]